MKDHDVTWLYGPLQTSSIQFFSSDTAPPASQLSRCNSFSSKKTILKKRSLSELMLQRSLSSSTLVKQATDALRAQQPATNLHVSSADGNEARSNLAKSNPEKIDLKMITGPPTPIPSVSTSGMQTPCTKRHIHFNNKVEQCIAINKSSGHEDYYSAIHDDSSDEDLLMMKPVHNSRTKRSHHSTPRNSFSGESKTIAMLPSTTLNYRGDTPDPILQEIKQNAVGRKAAPRYSPPIPQEIFKPTPQNTNNSVPSREGRTLTTPPTNFLLDEEDEEFDMEWQPSPLRREGIYVHKREEADYGSHDEQNDGLRQTPSGMFMPYDDDEGAFAAGGIIGRVFDTVNTAKDIAHVIWNVGWRK